MKAVGWRRVLALTECLVAIGVLAVLFKTRGIADSVTEQAISTVGVMFAALVGADGLIKVGRAGFGRTGYENKRAVTRSQEGGHE